MPFPALIPRGPGVGGGGGKRAFGGSPACPLWARRPPFLPPGFRLCPLPRACTPCLIQLPEALPVSSLPHEPSATPSFLLGWVQRLSRHPQPATIFLPPTPSLSPSSRLPPMSPAHPPRLQPHLQAWKPLQSPSSPSPTPLSFLSPCPGCLMSLPACPQGLEPAFLLGTLPTPGPRSDY